MGHDGAMPIHETVPSFVTGRILRVRYAILSLIAIASGVVAGGRGDWDQFAQTGRDMLGADGLQVFVRKLDTQTGPVALLVVRLFAVTPRDGFVLCTVVCAALGLVSIRCAELAAILGSEPGGGRRARAALTSLVGGVLLVFAWAKLGGYGHLDDAIVLTIAVGSLLLVRTDRWVAAAVLLGVALAVKPWAVLFLPLLLALRSDRPRLGLGLGDLADVWQRWRYVVLASCIGVALWAPFLVAAPSTLRSIRPTVRVASDSVLRLFGIDDASLPNWLRIAQLMAAIAIGLLAVQRRRIGGLIVVVVGVRVATDPGTWSYYTPGLVLGALAWDLGTRRRLIPVATIAATVLIAPSWLVPSDELRAALRLAAGLVAIAAVFAISEPAPSAAPSCPSSDPSAAG